MRTSRVSAVVAVAAVAIVAGFSWADLIRVKEPWVFFKPTAESSYAAVVASQPPDPSPDGIYLGLAIRDSLRDGQRVVISSDLPASATLANMLGSRIVLAKYPTAITAEHQSAASSPGSKQYPGGIRVAVGDGRPTEYTVFGQQGAYVIVPSGSQGDGSPE